MSCCSPGDLPDLEIEPMSLMSPALAGGFFTASATWEASSVQFSSVPSLSHVQIFADCSLPGSSVRGIPQAAMLEKVPRH